MPRRLAAAACLLAACAAGCGESPPPPKLSVLVEPDEPLSKRDFADFLRLAEAFGPDRLTSLGAALPDPIRWPAETTRTVAGLSESDRDAVRGQLHGATLAADLRQAPTAARLLEQVGWSAGRFASVGASLGFASAANDLPNERELRRLLAEAERQVEPLFQDYRVFGSLSAAEAAAVRRRAEWIPRRELLDALLASPPENRKLVSRNHDALSKLFPPGFDQTALDKLLSDRERSAIPFHEPNSKRDDANLRWDGGAIVTVPPTGSAR